MKTRHIVITLALAALALLLYACARDYVTGKRTFTLVSEDQEVAMGAQADPAIVAEFGLYDDPKLAAYIDSIGQAIARVSHRPNLQYTFRVVDSPVVNAFALPGGWVYFTRGILAHFNSEDELAGVMGHEVGHVVARHSAEQMSKAQLAQLGLGIGSIVSETFAQFSQLAETSLALIFLKFGRDQESESDRLGVEYSTRLGYDAHKMAGFFRTISRLSEQSGQSIPTFLSTHPNPENREQTVHQLAGEWQQKVDFNPRSVSREKYLRRIEGIVYGENPRQGFVENNKFYHPDLRFEFPVPEGWKLQNNPSSVIMIDAAQKAIIQFSLAQQKSLTEAVSAFIKSSGVTAKQQTPLKVNAFSAIALESTVTSQQSGPLGVLSYFIQKDDYIYIFHSYTTLDLYSQYTSTFRGVMGGFDLLRNQAALNKKPTRLRIAAAPGTGTLAAQLKSLGMKDDKVDELALLNGMEPNDQVQRGYLLKIIGE